VRLVRCLFGSLAAPYGSKNEERGLGCGLQVVGSEEEPAIAMRLGGKRVRGGGRRDGGDGGGTRTRSTSNSDRRCRTYDGMTRSSNRFPPLNGLGERFFQSGIRVESDLGERKSKHSK
jgi:hypothetical protein